MTDRRINKSQVETEVADIEVEVTDVEPEVEAVSEASTEDELENYTKGVSKTNQQT
jgi:hypothetical protein